MWDGFNKRKFPRLNLRCELILRDRSAGEVIRSQTENVGAGGVAVMINRPLERFSLLSLRLELDPNLPWIETTGRVVWCVSSRDLSAKKECFDTGIEFTEIEPVHQELIRRYVESRVPAKEPL